jgi:CRP-like cAMP-binding protein
MAAAAPFRSFARAIGQISGSARKIDIGRYRAAAAEHPGIGVLMDLYKSQQQVDLAQSVACNAIHRVGQRLAKWLLRCHDRVEGNVLPLTQELIGQMLGAQRTTVTEQAGDLQRAGLISYHRGQLAVTDRAGLERAACECYAIVRARELEFMGG